MEEIDQAYFGDNLFEKGQQSLQTFRKIELDIKIENGQKFQVAVCDPEDPEKFHPTDKVLVYKQNDSYYATSSYCGFDYTNLDKGVFLGDKIICPTCESSYCITTGQVDQGPSMRNLSSFLI